MNVRSRVSIIYDGRDDEPSANERTGVTTVVEMEFNWRNHLSHTLLASVLEDPTATFIGRTPTLPKRASSAMILSKFVKISCQNK